MNPAVRLIAGQAVTLAVRVRIRQSMQLGYVPPMNSSKYRILTSKNVLITFGKRKSFEGKSIGP